MEISLELLEQLAPNECFTDKDFECQHCFASLLFGSHKLDCPWLQARELINDYKMYGGH